MCEVVRNYKNYVCSSYHEKYPECNKVCIIFSIGCFVGNIFVDEVKDGIEILEGFL